MPAVLVAACFAFVNLKFLFEIFNLCSLILLYTYRFPNMDGGRSRRQAGRGGKNFKSALQELAELRKSGAKRADLYEVREEENVYDEVDEDEYARIVQKRREEGGKIIPHDRNVIQHRQHAHRDFNM